MMLETRSLSRMYLRSLGARRERHLAQKTLRGFAYELSVLGSSRHGATKPRPFVTAAAASGQPRIAVVTGGARGLGEAISRAFADSGDKVIVADVLEELGSTVATSIGGDFVKCDVRDAASVQSLIEGTAAKHGRVDIVVANAGIAPVPCALHMITDDDWNAMMSINGFGVFVTCKHALRQMLQQESGGTILAMSSTAGLLAHPGIASYSFTKNGVISLTKTIAVEYSKKNIRMNCICPATTETTLVKEFIENIPKEAKVSVQNANPIPGMIQPSHVAQAAVMLCSDNKYLTGVVLPVDGAFTVASANYRIVDYVEVAELAGKQ